MCGRTRKLEPGVSVDLKEGDTFTIGVSTRLYRLRFVSQFDAALPQQQDQPQQQVQIVKVRFLFFSINVYIVFLAFNLISFVFFNCLLIFFCGLDWNLGVTQDDELN